jgi:hypothetical protein
MRSQHDTGEHRHQQSHEAEAHHDPLQSIREEAPSFNRSWLKNGESMPLVQRVGFALISLMSVLVGVWLVSGAIESFREGEGFFIFFALSSVVFMLFGALGLRNVLRFVRKH